MSCGILVAPELQQAFTASTVGVLPAHPSPANRGGCDVYPMKKEDLYARMMHTPDDPERARVRAILRETWKQLLPLHKALIDAASVAYSESGREISGPTHRLQLLQEDPFFAWIRPLTSLIVEIDTLARIDFAEEDIAGVAGKLERLFGSEADMEFSERYLPLLQTEVDVAIGHAAMRQALLKLVEQD